MDEGIYKSVYQKKKDPLFERDLLLVVVGGRERGIKVS